MGDKPNVLLCPAAWFNFCFDDDFGCIINSAVRYSIGRETYMPSTVASYVRNYMDVLDRKTINVYSLASGLLSGTVKYHTASSFAGKLNINENRFCISNTAARSWTEPSTAR